MPGAEEPVDRETYDLISKSLSHPIRRKMLRLLNQKGRMAFSELRDSLGIDGSHLSYHIGQMGELLKKAEDGSYELSNLGIVAVSLMRDVEELSTKEAWKKPGETVTKRPVGLTLLYIGFAAMGVMLLLFILIGLFLFYSSFSLLFPWMREARLILSVTSGATAIMFFTIASGLRGLKAWGWWSAFSFFAGSIVAPLVSIFTRPLVQSISLSIYEVITQALNIGIYALLLWYLKGKRRWFKGLDSTPRRTLVFAVGTGLLPCILSFAMQSYVLVKPFESTPTIINVKGIVTDSLGTPLPSMVYFHRATQIFGKSAVSPPVAFSTTDENGGFEVSLPEGYYLVKAYSLGHVVSEEETYLQNGSSLAIRLSKLNATAHDLEFSDIFNHSYSISSLDRKIIILCVWGSGESIPVKDFLLLLNRIRQSFFDEAAFIIFKAYGADKTPDSLAVDQDPSWIVEDGKLSWNSLPERERSIFYETTDGKTIIPIPNIVVLNRSRQEVFRLKGGKNFIAKAISGLVSDNALPFISKFEQEEANGTTKLRVKIYNPGPLKHLTVKVECRKYVFGVSPGMETTYQLAVPFDAAPGVTGVEIDLKQLYRGEMLLTLLHGGKLIDMEEVSTYSLPITG